MKRGNNFPLIFFVMKIFYKYLPILITWKTTKQNFNNLVFLKNKKIVANTIGR